MNLKKELDICRKLAIDAGKEILRYYNDDIEVEYKKDNSPVTLADKKANDMIVVELKKEFPDYAVLTEESEDDLSRLKNKWCWIIDPLDGTKEFIKHNGEFTVNIALCFENRSVLGVVYSPVSEDLFYASSGCGAYYEKKCSPVKINVSARLMELRVIKSRSHAHGETNEMIRRNIDKIASITESGSSIKGCLVAKGDADIYYRFRHTSEWDTAAMQCIVEEAGGIVRQLDDTELLYNRENIINEKGFYVLNNIKNKMII